MLNDADLHGLVDGHLDAERRAEVLRRAAMSPRDRALVEEWQDQTDLIRAAFAGVEAEPLPQTLDIRTRPPLRAVAGATRDPVATSEPAVPRSRQSPGGRSPAWRSLSRRRAVVAVATLVALCAGSFGAWYVATQPVEAGRIAPARDALDDERMVADRTIASLAFGDAETSLERADSPRPPVVAAIPDLSPSGFTFADAHARGLAPRSIVFRYRNADGDRVAIGALRSSGGEDDIASRESGFVWRKGHVVYAVYGTVPTERLRTIAAEVRSQSAAD